MKVEIRGVIVGNISEYFQEYEDKGIITSEGKIRRAVSEAKEGIDLYINSPGGSVFSAYEMANVLNDYIVRTGEVVNVTIGAICASAAAYLMLAFGGQKIRAHKNSKIMFHSARVSAEGGPDAMKDTADLLQKINDDIASMLASQGVPEEKIKTWLSEGRAGWLTAQEAKEYGMVSEIIDAEAPKERAKAKDILQIANPYQMVAYEIESDETIDPETAKQMADEAYQEGFIAGKVEGSAEKITDLEKKLDEAKFELSAKEEMIADLTAKLATTRKELEAVGGAFNLVTEKNFRTFGEAVAGLEADGMDKEKAVFTARKQYPALYDRMIKNANKR